MNQNDKILISLGYELDDLKKSSQQAQQINKKTLGDMGKESGDIGSKGGKEFRKGFEKELGFLRMTLGRIFGETGRQIVDVLEGANKFFESRFGHGLKVKLIGEAGKDVVQGASGAAGGFLGQTTATALGAGVGGSGTVKAKTKAYADSLLNNVASRHDYTSPPISETNTVSTWSKIGSGILSVMKSPITITVALLATLAAALNSAGKGYEKFVSDTKRLGAIEGLIGEIEKIKDPIARNQMLFESFGDEGVTKFKELQDEAKKLRKEVDSQPASWLSLGANVNASLTSISKLLSVTWSGITKLGKYAMAPISWAQNAFGEGIDAKTARQLAESEAGLAYVEEGKKKKAKEVAEREKETKRIKSEIAETEKESAMINKTINEQVDYRQKTINSLLEKQLTLNEASVEYWNTQKKIISEKAKILDLEKQRKSELDKIFEKEAEIRKRQGEVNRKVSDRTRLKLGDLVNADGSYNMDNMVDTRGVTTEKIAAYAQKTLSLAEKSRFNMSTAEFERRAAWEVWNAEIMSNKYAASGRQDLAYQAQDYADKMRSKIYSLNSDERNPMYAIQKENFDIAKEIRDLLKTEGAVIRPKMGK